jgi:hypothetical protein
MERREKVEEARRETERILAEQEAEVARRKVRNTAQDSTAGSARQQHLHAHMQQAGQHSLEVLTAERQSCIFG